MKKLRLILYLAILSFCIIKVFNYFLEDKSIDVAKYDETTSKKSFILSDNLLEGRSEKEIIDEDEYAYKAYKTDTKKLIDMSYIKIAELSDKHKLVRWSIEGEGYVHLDMYLLNPNNETIKWEINESDLDTYYSGYREGNMLTVSGMHRGKQIKKSLKIDENPFFYNPKLGLVPFLKSDQETLEFWSMRIATLEPHPMKAEKLGKETIDFNGQKVDVIKVYWAAKGIGERFFNRTYYFRESDGMFLTQDEVKGWTLDLVVEE